MTHGFSPKPHLNPTESPWESHCEGKQHTSLNSVWEAADAAGKVDRQQIKKLTDAMNGAVWQQLWCFSLDVSVGWHTFFEQHVTIKAILSLYEPAPVRNWNSDSRMCSFPHIQQNLQSFRRLGVLGLLDNRQPNLPLITTERIPFTYIR